MKGTKTSLFLIELMISLLLFAFCAAICVQIFHASNRRTNSAKDLSKAVFQATTAAELYKSVGGDIEALAESFDGNHSHYRDNILSVYFDENWNETVPPMFRATLGTTGYTLEITDKGDNCADITVIRTSTKYYGDVTMNGVHEDIFEITVKAVVS